MSNVDKHRLIPTTGALPLQGSFTIRFNRPVTVFGKRHFAGPIAEGRPLVELSGAFENADDVDIEADITPHIIFDERADPACVQGRSLPEVIDGIFSAFAEHVFPELGPECVRCFGQGIVFTYEQSGRADPAAPSGA